MAQSYVEIIRASTLAIFKEETVEQNNTEMDYIYERYGNEDPKQTIVRCLGQSAVDKFANEFYSGITQAVQEHRYDTSRSWRIPYIDEETTQRLREDALAQRDYLAVVCNDDGFRVATRTVENFAVAESGIGLTSLGTVLELTVSWL